MSEKTSIWSAVEKTDVSATKKVPGGGRKVTSINAIYMVKRATETFGPVGIGWGYEIVEERFDAGSPIYNDASEIVGTSTNHTIRLRLWFKDPESGEKGTVEHFGHTKYMYGTSRGVFVDEEAPKKSLTDAVKKCLSMLGFSADVFLGQFDDDHYVDALAADEAISKAENKIEEEVKQELERKEWIKKVIKSMEDSVSLSMLEGIYKESLRKAQVRKWENEVLRIERCKGIMLPKLKAKEADK